MIVVAVVVYAIVSSSGGSPKPKPVPLAKPKPKPKPAPKPKNPFGAGRSWPQYGNGPGRSRYMAKVSLLPPLSKVWSFNGGKLIEFQPVLAGGRLFVLKNDGRALALSSLTGRVRWRHRIGALAASSPTTGGASVYFVGNGAGGAGIASAGRAKIVAVNRRTGKVRWAKRLGGASESSPLVIGSGRTARVYLGSQDGTVYGLSAVSGRIVWRYHAGSAVKGALAYLHGRLFFGDYGGSVTALRAKNGSVAWRSGVGGEIYATVAVAFGRVFVGSKSGAVSALSASNGRRLWSRGTGGYVYAAPAVASVPGMRPAVFIGSYSGRFMALAASSGRLLWSRSGGGTISGAASVIGRVVYFSSLTARRTYAVSAKSGRLLWTFHKGAFNPAISDGRRIYITGYGGEYAFTSRRELRREKRLVKHLRRH